MVPEGPAWRAKKRLVRQLCSQMQKPEPEVRGLLAEWAEKLREYLREHEGEDTPEVKATTRALEVFTAPDTRPSIWPWRTQKEN